MAIVRMQKAAVLAHKDWADAIITRLQEEGVIDVSATTKPVQPADRSESAFRTADLDFAIGVLTAAAPKDVLKKLQSAARPEEIIAAAHATDVRGITDRLHALHADDVSQERELAELRADMQQLRPWSGLREPLPVTAETATCIRVFGMLPHQKCDELSAALAASLPRTSLNVIGTDAVSVCLSAFVWKEDMEAFESLATAAGWTTVRPPERTGMIGALLTELHQRETAAIERLKSNAAERKAASRHLPDLVRVRLYMNWLQGRDAVRQGMTTTASMIVITGWMAADRLAAVEKSLGSVTRAVAVLPVEPDEGEEPPVLIRNRLLVSPFESVTTLYGLPLASEMDPTAALAPFFALFFALCITDAGYGLAISVIMGVYLLVTKQAIRSAPLWWAVFFGGIASFLVGIPFGGWFGLDPNKLPAALDFLRTPVGDGYWFKLQIWNLGTQEGIQFLQNLSLALGITHLFFGMFLAGWHKWVNGRRASAFWEHFTSHLLLVAVLFRAFAPAAYVPAAAYALYASVVLIIWGKGYGNPWYLRPVMGLLGVVNFAIGLLSNGLSYLRILALGLVTGAIALAVDQVAVEMGNLFPVWIGIPVMVVVAVAGHAVSIALNTLGSFIHAGRLQFIEFFSQFFEGGGRAFSPFSRTTNS